jgi:DNA-binding winged helix-turn-helix (wHTH) protein
VLCALAHVQGKLVTKNALRDRVWGHGFVTDAVLKSTISRSDPRGRCNAGA